jgi:hypothetical protein
MRAITEIPANTPRPMGSTWRDRPGTTKADEDAEAAAFSAAAVGPVPETALAAPADAGTEVTPSSDTAAAPAGAEDPETAAEVVAAGAEVVAAAAEVVTAEAAMEDTPLSLTAPPPPDAVVADPAEESVVDALDPEASVEVLVDEDESVDELEESVDELEESVDELEESEDELDELEEPEDDETDEPPFEEPLFCPFIVTVHVLTSWTAGLPLLSVTGVRVMTQVCCMSPADVEVVDEVVTVVACWSWACLRSRGAA